MTGIRFIGGSGADPMDVKASIVATIGLIVAVMLVLIDRSINRRKRR